MSSYFLLKAPGVNVYLVAGTEINTDAGYLYDATGWINGPLQTKSVSGDGTVPLASALLPAKQWGWPNVNSTLFPHNDHVGILSSGPFLEWLVSFCSNIAQ